MLVLRKAVREGKSYSTRPEIPAARCQSGWRARLSSVRTTPAILRDQTHRDKKVPWQCAADLAHSKSKLRVAPVRALRSGLERWDRSHAPLILLFRLATRL